MLWGDAHVQWSCSGDRDCTYICFVDLMQPGAMRSRRTGPCSASWHSILKRQGYPACAATPYFASFSSFVMHHGLSELQV